MSAPVTGLTAISALDHLANSDVKMLRRDEIGALEHFLEPHEISALIKPPFVRDQESLTEDESSYAKLVARIVRHVANTFGVEKVRPWLHEPFLRFGRRSPLDVMKDPKGAEQVKEYLVQIDEGYFA